VRLLQPGLATPGNWRAEWDGRDGYGRRVSPGVYFVRWQSASANLAARVMMIP